MKKRSKAFTLVELIVVITILAILATIGFLALSGYSQDAKESAIKANVRSVQNAISAESALTGNSPRYYVVHDTGAALSGAFVYVDGTKLALTGGDVGSLPADSNYTAGNPNYARLKINPDKFKVSSGDLVNGAYAAYDSKFLSVGAIDWSSVSSANGRTRTSSYFQVAGVDSNTKKAVVTGNFPTPTTAESASGAVS
ncbi:MAG: type II secretion system protein [Patescibacteria group bacterium]